VIIVFAQELVPGRVGMVAGIFFGLSFGLGGIAAAVLGVAGRRSQGIRLRLSSSARSCPRDRPGGAIFLPRRRELRAG
jgi:hypothetical protein